MPQRASEEVGLQHFISSHWHPASVQPGPPDLGQALLPRPAALSLSTLVKSHSTDKQAGDFSDWQTDPSGMKSGLPGGQQAETL
ncbi:hypothetical protein AOLI_G00325960 [Acnodon oligacanthus]